LGDIEVVSIEVHVAVSNVELVITRKHTTISKGGSAVDRVSACVSADQRSDRRLPCHDSTNHVASVKYVRTILALQGIEFELTIDEQFHSWHQGDSKSRL
jgi:hypothetical protein